MAESIEDLKLLLAQQEALFGHNHPKVAATLSTIGDLLSSKNDAAGAEQIYWRVVEIWQRVNGGKNVELSRALVDLAGLHQKQERLADAERMLRWCSELRLSLFGALHPDYLSSVSQLQQVLQAQGKQDDSLAGITALQLSDDKSGAEKFPWDAHHKTALSLLESGKLSEAGAYVSCLRDTADCFATNSIWQGRVYQLQSKVCQAQGNLSLAQTCLKNAMAVFERELGTQCREVMQCMLSLAALYIAAEQSAKARFLLKGALRVAIALEGENCELAGIIGQELADLPADAQEDELIDGSFLSPDFNAFPKEPNDPVPSRANVKPVSPRVVEVPKPQMSAPVEIPASSAPVNDLASLANFAASEEFHSATSSPPAPASHPSFSPATQTNSSGSSSSSGSSTPSAPVGAGTKFTDDAKTGSVVNQDDEDQIFAAFAQLNTGADTSLAQPVVSAPAPESPVAPPATEPQRASFAGVDPSEFMRESSDSSAPPHVVEASPTDRADDLFSQMMAMEQLEKKQKQQAAQQQEPAESPKVISHPAAVPVAEAKPAVAPPTSTPPPAPAAEFRPRTGEQPAPSVSPQFGSAFGLPGTAAERAPNPVQSPPDMQEFDSNLSTFLWEKYIKAGKLATSQRNHVEAERMFTVALEKAEVFGDERLWQTLALLGRSLQLQKKPDKAANCFLRAQMLCEHTGGPEHADNITHFKNLGGLYFEQSDIVQAEQYYARALKLMMHHGKSETDQQELKTKLEQCKEQLSKQA